MEVLLYDFYVLLEGLIVLDVVLSQPYADEERLIKVHVNSELVAQ
jgi:hypothetical protein